MRRSLLTTPLPRPRARWITGRGEGFDYNALSLSLALAVDVQQFNRCQIARSIMCTLVSSLLDLPRRRRAKCKVHTSTNCWTSRRGKEPSARFYRSCRPSRSVLQLYRMMLLYDAATSRISKVVPPFFLKERVGARATTTQVARTHNTFTSNKF